MDAKKIATIALSLVTLVLAGVGIFIAFTIQNNQNAGRNTYAGCWCTGQAQCNAGWDWSGGEGYCDTAAGLRCCNEPGSNNNNNNTTSSAATCVANKREGDVCAPSCGNNACDGSGPLGCNRCSGGSKSGQYVCSAGIANDSYNRACGISGTNPNGTPCTFNSECSSNSCVAGTCGGSNTNPGTNCSGTSNRPNTCGCSSDGQCASGYCADNNPRLCYAKEPNGSSCASSRECQSGYCIDSGSGKKCSPAADVPGDNPNNGLGNSEIGGCLYGKDAQNNCIDNPTSGTPRVVTYACPASSGYNDDPVFQNSINNGCQVFFRESTGTENLNSCAMDAAKAHINNCGVVQCDSTNGTFKSSFMYSGCQYRPTNGNPTTTATTTTSNTTTNTTSNTSTSRSSSSTTSTTSTTTSTTSSTTSSSTSTTAVNCVELTIDAPEDATTQPTPPGTTYAITAEWTCAGLNTNLKVGIFDGSNNLISSIANQSSAIYNQDAGTCTYTFNVSSPNALADGTYYVKQMTNGTTSTRVDAPVSCLKPILVQSTAVPDPAMVITKSATMTAGPSAGSIYINYSLIARNIGDVPAYVTTIRDDLPPEIDGSNTTQVSNINPNTGVTRTANYIEWAVNSTFVVNEQRTYSYRVFLTAQQAATYGGDCLRNVVDLNYGPDTTPGNPGDDSTYQFENYVCLPTTGGTPLPSTGLFDQEGIPLWIGLFLILGGILVNRYPYIMNTLGYSVEGNAAQNAGNRIAEAMSNFGFSVRQMLFGRTESGFKERLLRSQERKTKEKRK